jgi:hypothetical protein
VPAIAPPPTGQREGVEDLGEDQGRDDVQGTCAAFRPGADHSHGEPALAVVADAGPGALWTCDVLNGEVRGQAAQNRQPRIGFPSVGLDPIPTPDPQAELDGLR